MEYPRHSLTLIVKGTFSLNPEGKTVPAENPAFPSGDDFYSDDEKRESIRYESDFAWFKPRADLLLHGKCHTPEGRPKTVCPVTFQVGAKSRNLIVFGDRRWKRNALGLWKMTEPEPFTEMDLRYENSFGGEGYAYNPIGKGFSAEYDQEGRKSRFLPDIEDPNALTDSPRSRRPPAGFGPLSRMWHERRSRMGTYRGKYGKERWPWLSEDFDWSHCNAAPPEMQVEGYLRGDEKLYFENLHPKRPEYHSQLPGMRVRCFLNRSDEPEKQEGNFEEVSMNLDTLWVDMEAEKLVLVWRGWAPVLSEDYEEVRDLFILSEPLAQQPASLQECRQLFRTEKTEQGKDWSAEPEAADEPAAVESQPKASTPSAPPSQDNQNMDPDYLQAQANALMVQMGINPDNLAPEAKEKQSRMIRKLTETDPAKVAEMEQWEIDNQMREAYATLNINPDHLPPLSAKAQAEQFRFMKELGIKPTDVATDPEFGKVLALMGAALPKMGLDPENLDPLIEQAKKYTGHFKKQFDIEEEGEQTGKEKELDAPLLTRDVVQERAARGESFSGEDLHGLDLSKLDLSGLDFSKSNLAGSVLAGANLQFSILTGSDLTGANLLGVDLTGANLSEADLSKTKIGKSILKDADLTGCILMNSDLTGAILTDAVFEKTRMAGAVLDKVEAKETNFSEADLTECSFRDGTCAGADFSKAILDNTDFQCADLSKASVEGAVGRKINMAEANLTELRASEGCDFTDGVFWNSIGPGSIWEDSNLTGSDFRGSRMEGAVFAGSCLKQADLSFADMKFCRFNKADLQGARLVRMNLFQGSLEKANLTGADLSGSNMYGVEFLDAILEKIRTNGTNLKMSKLQ
jgi:uncharacterized protein YjbI with pentapeptide repeats